MHDSVTPEGQIKLAVLEELHRVFEGGLEGASERQRNLLSYLVTEELEGRGDRLKAYSIATTVFGRPKDFDPQQDSIVRVEVGRLRQALERHYLSEGGSAPLAISIPKGQYRPVFTPAPAAVTHAPPPADVAAPRRRLPLWAAALAVLCLLGAAAWSLGPWPRDPAPGAGAARRGPVVAVAPFDFHADREGQEFVAAGLQADLADVLSDYRWLTVIPLGEDSPAGGAKPDFVVRATLRLIGDQVKATVLLLDAASGAARWTSHYELPLKAGDVMAMQRDLVARIGRDVGNPFGIAADMTMAPRGAGAGLTDEALACQMRAFHYWKTFKSQDYAPAWRCFENLSARRELDANTLSVGAILTLDPLNRRLTSRTLAQTRADAAALAERAVAIDGFDFIPNAARYAAALCQGDFDAFRFLAREIVERFPNNPLALADVGARFILGSGDAAEGVALIERARAIAPDLTPLDTVAIAVDALRRGAYEDRPRLRRSAERTDAAAVLIVELALASARGDAEETARVRTRLATLGFSDEKRIGEALDATCWSQNIRDLVKSKVALAFSVAPAR